MVTVRARVRLTVRLRVTPPTGDPGGGAGRGGAGRGGGEAHLGEHTHELEGVDEALALRCELDLANVGPATEDGEAGLRGCRGRGEGSEGEEASRGREGQVRGGVWGV